MVSPSRSSTSRRRREDAGKFVIGGLILLGLVASVFLVFSNSLQFVRVGLVAALWAAAIGALAATKYRKDATVDKAKVRDLQTVYELQLEREVTARREYELGVEARVRAEVGADATELAALRAELTVLRQSLQRLFDGDLPEERLAVRADSTRIQELPSASGDLRDNSSGDAGIWTDSDQQQTRSSATPIFEPSHPEPPVFASPFDEPITAETAAVNPADIHIAAANITDAQITDADIDDSGFIEPLSGPSGWADAFTEVGKDELAEPKPAAAVPRQPATPPRPAASAPTMGTASSRRRRRDIDSDDSSTRRLSVAEIMANLQSEERNRTV
ncbi:DUF6779 domain-containing protein [Nocardia arthritidis]|uniref:DUF6779 domain-containing protein n=1 Tax=Nocardia arthritidis TaxID=228602 RepID=A0A6G9Y558_9NOCA|nr:DUF6779 domain-containing protein [Nocardia arthritidis]QIS08375.1 hypothetical protein F5544_02275 [Nocardia arthritidis]